MDENLDKSLNELAKSQEEVVNLMYTGIFSELQDENEKYLSTITSMAKCFVESVDRCLLEVAQEQQSSIVSVAISYLQMSLNVICRPIEDEMREKILMMAFPDYDIKIAKRQKFEEKTE